MGGTGSGRGLSRPVLVPFDGFEATFSNASDCDRHVTVQKHPKKRQGDAKNWLCRGRHTRVLYKKEGNEMVILKSWES